MSQPKRSRGRPKIETAERPDPAIVAECFREIEAVIEAERQLKSRKQTIRARFARRGCDIAMVTRTIVQSQHGVQNTTEAEYQEIYARVRREP